MKFKLRDVFKYLAYGAEPCGIIVLPPEEALERIENGRQYFWSRNRNPESSVAVRSLAKLYELGGVRGHAHMFRYTFAVGLLKIGVSQENVAALLGNSVRIAEKHYAPWVKARQETLEREVKKTWT